MANSQNEPTMEEILASIRKIIAEDPPGNEGTDASVLATEEPEVLELTEEVHAEGRGEAASAYATAGEQAQEAVAERSSSDGGEAIAYAGDGIFSDKTRKALNDAFAGLDTASPGTTDEEVPSMSGLPIEAVFEKAVREAFQQVFRKWMDDNAAALLERSKPAISDWLDEHFPAMLEDAVRNEVARAVMARRR